MTTGKLDGEPASAGLPDWLSGVPQGGTQLSATSHRPVDRPELSSFLSSDRLARSRSSDGLSICRWSFHLPDGFTPFLGLADASGRPVDVSKNKGQLNTLQTVVLRSNHEEEIMVKPHGSLVPVS